MKSILNILKQSLVLAAFLGGTLSCSRADILPDIAGLRQQIEKGSPEILTAITGSAEVQSYLLKLHPGALFYLADSLEQKGAHAEARVLFREQLAMGGSAWRGLSFRGWLEASMGLQDWQGVLDQAPGLYAAAQAETAPAVADRSLSSDRAASAEAYHRQMVEALSQLKRWDAAWQEARAWRDSLGAAQGLAIGESNQPAWLPHQIARLRLQRTPALALPLSDDILADILPYALGTEARAGHGDVLWLLDQGIQGEHRAPDPAPVATGQDRVLREVLHAKDLLARNEAVESWTVLRGFLLPPQPVAPSTSKATKAKKEAFQRATLEYDLAAQQLRDLAGLHHRAGLQPTMFIRDFYNAARLAGRFTEGMGALDALRRDFLERDPEWKKSLCVPYLLELKGRLARAASNWSAAVTCFEEALDLAKGLEAAGRMAQADRQRVQWYLLSSMVESVDDFSGPLFNLAAFLKLAASCEPGDYFADVLETALVKIGCRRDWAAMERFDAELKGILPLPLHWRCTLVLARVRQLAHPAKLESDARFQELTQALATQTDSLYYQLIGRWMRGEASDLAALLSSRPDRSVFAKSPAGAGSSAPANWAETVSAGYWDMGMYDAGLEFSWDRRQDLPLSWFASLGSAYVAAGRYRQGLKILDSVRLRAGHPDQRPLLDAFYPRPYAPAMAAAQASPAAAAVPEWLMYALTRTESLFDLNAQSGPGAQGLSQLMPATARIVAKGLKIEAPDLSDPATNLMLGSVYLADQFRSLGQWPQALAAYNAGASRVRAWQKAGIGNDPILFSELIPFEETRNYVRRITESAAIYGWLHYQLDAGSVLSIVYTPAGTYRQ